MIISPQNAKEWQACAQFLNHHAGVHPTADLQMMGWVDQDELKIVVGFNGFLGKVCQIHIAMKPDWHFSPREMLKQVFRYGFITCQRELLIGIVNSKNEKAMKWDLHLGFREMYRIPNMHDDDGDIVVLGMVKKNCRYLNMIEPVGEDGGILVGTA